jgi:hypothetical protein
VCPKISVNGTRKKKVQNNCKWAKVPGVNFEFVNLRKRKNSPSVKFDFGPLNTKRPKWAPKMGISPEVNFEFGAQTRAKQPRSI